MLCEITRSGNIASDFEMMDDMDFLIAKSRIYGARTTASVKINPNTGKIGGWESLFELLARNS
jgi:hypothetical protein